MAAVVEGWSIGDDRSIILRSSRVSPARRAIEPGRPADSRPHPDGRRRSVGILGAVAGRASSRSPSRARAVQFGCPGRGQPDRHGVAIVVRGQPRSGSRAGSSPRGSGRPRRAGGRSSRGPCRHGSSRTPCEVGHPPTGLLDHDRRRGEVPAVRPDLDHRLGGALGDQRVAPEVAEAPVAPGRPDQGIEARRLARSPRCRAATSTGAGHPRARRRARRRSAAAPRRPARARRPPTRPPPRRAYQRWPSAGALMTPATSSPSSSTASRVPNRGTPRMKLCVPSIGSMYQRTVRRPASVPYSSPTSPWSG